VVCNAKVLLITNIPNPYRVPLFNELSRQLSTRGIGLKILFGAAGYERRYFNLDMRDCAFDYEILPARRLPHVDNERVSFTYGGLFSRIRKYNPDLIITNGFSVASMKLWMRSWLSDTPYLIWSGAIKPQVERLSLLRTLQRRLVASRAMGGIAYGTLAKSYLASFGVEMDSITIGINTVDTEFFREKVAQLRNAIKKNDQKKQLLSICYLTKGKRVDQLLRAIQVLVSWRRDFVLKILGAGPELENLRQMSHELEIADHVEFVGFVEKSDIPAYLAASDCFLFSTEYDIWGLVLVEAMAAGVTCIASHLAGATPDLVQEGVTGFAFDFSDSHGLARRINWVLDNEAASRHIGENAREFISNKVTLGISAGGFTAGIEKALLKRGCKTRETVS
jgi:glycosyltransferase involved in cell wall biosynthesis